MIVQSARSAIPKMRRIQKQTHRLLKSMPLLQEAVWETKRLARGSVTAYTGRWQTLATCFADYDSVGPMQVDLPRRRVLVFASTAMYVDCLLPTALMLASRNCDVDFVWLPYISGMAHPMSDRFQRWSDRFPVPRHAVLPMISLLDVAPAPATGELRAMAEAVADYDACYCRRKEECDYEGDPGDKRFFDFRVQRNLDALRRIESLLNQRTYDSALTGNGCLFEMGGLYKILHRRGIPCASIDTFNFNSEIAASQTKPAVLWDMEDIWAADAPHVLTPEREKRVADYVAYREDPGKQIYGLIQPAAIEAAESIRAKLQLDATKRLCLLCTNVAWDSAVLKRGVAFATMREWIGHAVEYFKKRPDWQLVIRTHPYESEVEQPRSISDIIDAAYPVLPPNVRHLRPKEKVNTYALIRMADVGLAFSSTVGLEMAMRGLHCILAADVHYQGKGFTLEPKSAGEYEALLDRVVRRELPPMTQRQIDLSHCYFDVYFEKFPKPFPWRLWKAQEDLKKVPIAALLRGDCPSAYLTTFDYLAGRPVTTKPTTTS